MHRSVATLDDSLLRRKEVHHQQSSGAMPPSRHPPVWLRYNRAVASFLSKDIDPPNDPSNLMGAKSNGLACLRKTTPDLNLSYPSSDAEAWSHYDEVHREMGAWLQTAPGFRMHGFAGYNGPWIENAWISHFQQRLERARARGRRLSAVFGPYIPLFVPFTDHWVHAGFKYPEGLVAALLRVLRSDTAYITVSQNDEGLTGKNELLMGRIPNVLVLSAGGYGHVPLPLLKQPEAMLPRVPLKARSLLVSFVGSLDSAPNRLRHRMRDELEAAAYPFGNKADSGTHSSQPIFAYRVARGLPARWSAFTSLMPGMVERAICYMFGVDVWRDVMANSRVSLCPRGYGRSSYHLAETIQMGRVPIHIYSDIAWVPYEKLFRRQLGFVVPISRLPSLLQWLSNASSNATDELARRERYAKKLRESHFTLAGVLSQVSRFMLNPRISDLQCRRLPSTVRDA